MPLQKGDNPYYAAETMPRKPKNPGIRFGYNQYLNEKRMERTPCYRCHHDRCKQVTINTSMKRGWKAKRNTVFYIAQKFLLQSIPRWKEDGKICVCERCLVELLHMLQSIPQWKEDGKISKTNPPCVAESLQLQSIPQWKEDGKNTML